MIRSVLIVLAVAIVCTAGLGCGGKNEAIPPKKYADLPNEEPSLGGGKNPSKGGEKAPAAAN